MHVLDLAEKLGGLHLPVIIYVEITCHLYSIKSQCFCLPLVVFLSVTFIILNSKNGEGYF